MNSQANQQQCQICGSETQAPVLYECKAFGDFYGRKVAMVCCSKCGFTSAADNHFSKNDVKLWADTRPMREGTSETPGREYHMAAMAIDILQIAGLPARNVLFFGSGTSTGSQHIKKRYPSIDVFISDLTNVDKVDNFISLESTQQFDITVACEVVEHFTDIKIHFSNLLMKLADDGIAVISTDINDGTEISQHSYIFLPGHTAYYSGHSITLAINNFDEMIFVDFRSPNNLGSRKRYVICCRNKTILKAIEEYFSEKTFAPSESRQATPWVRLHRFWLRGLRYLMAKTATMMQRDPARTV